MASLAEIREALKATLESNIPRINVRARVTEDEFGESIAIYPADTDYLYTFNGSSASWEFNLLVGVSEAEDEAAQYALDELVDTVGERSIFAVLLANQTLGRTDCTVKEPLRMTNYGAKIKFGDTELFGAIIRVGVATTHR